MHLDLRLHRVVAAQPCLLLFATITGAQGLPLEKVVRVCGGCGKLRASSKSHERQEKRAA